jgi:glucosamine--fructose-6-phosphate aminotransferase (isomerizing)
MSPTVLIATRDGVYEKNKSTLQEIKARGGKVITIALENDDDISEQADTVITVPETHHTIQPVINVIALQLFAYHLAVAFRKRCRQTTQSRKKRNSRITL